MSALYAGPVNAMKLLLSEADWDHAFTWGMARYRRQQGTRGTTAANGYWSPPERAIHGALGEILLRGLLGHDRYAPLNNRAQGGEPDVEDCEAKLTAWRRSSHMDNCEGGIVKVPEISRARRIAHFTFFPGRETIGVAFFDGWIYRTDALRYPIEYSNYGRWRTPVHGVPYACLLSPGSFGLDRSCHA